MHKDTFLHGADIKILRNVLVAASSVCSTVCSIKALSFVCVEVLRPSQSNGVMSSAVSLPNHTFTGKA